MNGSLSLFLVLPQAGHRWGAFANVGWFCLQFLWRSLSRIKSQRMNGWMLNQTVFLGRVSFLYLYFGALIVKHLQQIRVFWEEMSNKAKVTRYSREQERKRKMSSVSSWLYLLCSFHMCLCVTSLWTPKWKIHSPQQRSYSMWRLMRVAGHMSNDVNSHLGSGGRYYHLQHEMTRCLIWCLNKISQQPCVLWTKIIHGVKSLALCNPHY